MPSAKREGFTLLEVLITVTIVAILATIAVPSYQEHVRRGHRAAAQTEMMDIANRQQQFFLANRSYAASLAALGFSVPAEVSSRYDCNTTPGTGNPPTFTVTCNAKPGTSQVTDGDLTLNSQGEKSPPNKW